MNDLQGGRHGDPELAALGPWFHNLHLPDGRQTAPDHPLGDFPANFWGQIDWALDGDLRGATVLDIGCNAGFYSVAMALRGAAVHAIDVDERYLRQAHFVAERFGVAARIRFERRSVYRLHELREQYDLVLFLGVLYHLRYPLLALDQVRERTRGRLLFQSLSLPGDGVVTAAPDLAYEDLAVLLQPDWPRLAFVEHSFAGDPTNWWIPNRAALEALLRSSGFPLLQRLHVDTWLCAGAPADDWFARLRRAEMAAAGALGDAEGAR